VHKLLSYILDCKRLFTAVYDIAVSDCRGQYLEGEEKREAFCQNALLGWNEYLAAGLRVTREEAAAWLARLEAGKGTPSCRNATSDLVVRAGRGAACLSRPE